MRHLERRGRLEELAARVDSIGAPRRIELELGRRDGRALRDAKPDAEAERVARVDRAVGIDTYGAIALELGCDGVEIRARLHAEHGLALRRAGLDRLRQRGVVRIAQHDRRAVLAAENGRAVGGSALREAEVAPEAAASGEVRDAEGAGVQIGDVHLGFKLSATSRASFRGRRS